VSNSFVIILNGRYEIVSIWFIDRKVLQISACHNPSYWWFFVDFNSMVGPLFFSSLISKEQHGWSTHKLQMWFSILSFERHLDFHTCKSHVWISKLSFGCYLGPHTFKKEVISPMVCQILIFFAKTLKTLLQQFGKGHNKFCQLGKNQPPRKYMCVYFDLA
jgi:hypothetical protein